MAVEGYLVDFGAEPVVAEPVVPLRPRAPAGQDLFGIDIDVRSSLPPSFRLAGGFRNLANAIVRRLSTPAGWHAAAFDGDPDYGYDVLGKLNSAWTDVELEEVQANVRDQCQRDGRVRSATVAAAFSLATSTLDLDIELDTAAGPFRLVLRVSDVGIEMLRSE